MRKGLHRDIYCTRWFFRKKIPSLSPPIAFAVLGTVHILIRMSTHGAALTSNGVTHVSAAANVITEGTSEGRASADSSLVPAHRGGHRAFLGRANGG